MPACAAVRKCARRRADGISERLRARSGVERIRRRRHAPGIDARSTRVRCARGRRGHRRRERRRDRAGHSTAAREQLRGAGAGDVRSARRRGARAVSRRGLCVTDRGVRRVEQRREVHLRSATRCSGRARRWRACVPLSLLLRWLRRGTERRCVGVPRSRTRVRIRQLRDALSAAAALLAERRR